MRPVSLTYTGTVGVSIQDVFDLISDPSRMAEWLPNCVSVVPGPTGKGKGDRHRLHFERQGRNHLPPRLENLLQARLPGRHHQDHHEMRVGAGELARVAPRTVLPPEKCT